MNCLRWKPNAKKVLDPDFHVLVDDNVHGMTDSRIGGLYGMPCYPEYEAKLNHVFEPCEGPVTCLFCLAGERRFR